MNKVRKLNKVQKPYCSFCGKSQDQVEKLIAGPNVFICNECVRLCVKILDGSPPSTEQIQALQTDDVPLNGTLAKTVKKIISLGKERGYITYDELNKMLPASEFTSEQIDETMAMLSDIGINLIEGETDADDET